ncbi:MAG: hypothetical protein H6813_05200 [Phycisphaeraceae bacterium]|nr:hypothetical protein [Phycisphaeraceae bacterium]MCB9847781.1 hypothetical protein [Phycisphaeraceae bacterium]
MDNLKRSSVVACATAVGMALAAGEASAGIIVDTMDGTAFSPRDTTSFNPPTSEQTALVQGFTITDASTLNTASIRGYSQGADVIIAIASQVGPGTLGASVLFEQTFTVTADGVGTSVRTFDLGGLALGAGDYYFVVMSEDPDGFEWSKVARTGSIGVGDRGSSTFLSGASWYAQPYAFQTGASAQVFTLEIDGVAVPSPAGLATMLAAGAVAGTRRRRG